MVLRFSLAIFASFGSSIATGWGFLNQFACIASRAPGCICTLPKSSLRRGVGCSGLIFSSATGERLPSLFTWKLPPRSEPTPGLFLSSSLGLSPLLRNHYCFFRWTIDRDLYQFYSPKIKGDVGSILLKFQSCNRCNISHMAWFICILPGIKMSYDLPPPSPYYIDLLKVS